MTTGFILALLLVAFITVNGLRAFTNPVGFAQQFGLESSGAATYIYVYAIRALFLGMYGATLLIDRDSDGMGRFALVAIVMPIGDAILVARLGGTRSKIIRHGLIACFLLVTGLLLLQ